jgi:hypothetical protein
MITLMSKMTDRPVFAACTLGISLRGTGLSGRGSLAFAAAERSERPTQAPVAVAATQALAYAATAAAAPGAGNQKTTHDWMRAFRGLGPWSDPA